MTLHSLIRLTDSTEENRAEAEQVEDLNQVTVRMIQAVIAGRQARMILAVATIQAEVVIAAAGDAIDSWIC